MAMRHVGPVPIEAWSRAQVKDAVNGLQAQHQKLQRQVDELTARVQALEAVANQPPRSTGFRPKPEYARNKPPVIHFRRDVPARSVRGRRSGCC
jgi:hypothetical protein